MLDPINLGIIVQKVEKMQNTLFSTVSLKIIMFESIVVSR